ncbi:tRNA glutamyl-Q(34) synthetase GluQRS [Acidovorax sp. SRB_24]|uniref:tRNA glutamyl-Q(34) synthetase GluQRS n=1 Tax=Acidovorax sp. SRB_24 TaxID=1962700 RepID=UPI00145DFA2D|nr:tRNA glutamyl-Q(34) synthetase GluQRS [Acidovorax sp. SRB_24]NMM76515.1 tRNA glutamyl-Q(34) synthetase GluQRS [Acidovorax sp. SRB_24]
MTPAGYVGRFAPSPTGPLHAGSLVAALASWLDARAWNGGHGGRWLVRIEDVDTPRCAPGAGEHILAQLAACGLHPDAPPLWQSTRAAAYQGALDRLCASGLAYPCACSRKDIAAAHAARGRAQQRHVEHPYPGTCRHGLHGRSARAWRFNTTDFWPKQPLSLMDQAQAAIHNEAPQVLHWHDRRLGAQQQDVVASVGDFVLRRADGLWAYQLAVVVDDAAQGITHIVRGEDLADNTPRQILLQRALGAPTPQYLHTPLVRAADGEKLSKQHGAPPLDLQQPLQALAAAAAVLQLPAVAHPDNTTVPQALAQWCKAWAGLYNLAP